MQVYKTCFTIIKKHIFSISIYFGVFLLLTVLLTNFSNSGKVEEFEQTKTKVAFFNADEKSPLIDRFKKYLSENASLVTIDDNTEALQDALFFNRVEYIIRIPSGFAQSFLSGKHDVKIEKTTAAGLTAGVYTEFLIDKYFETAALYIKAVPGISAAQVAANTAHDLDQKAQVTMKNFGKKESDKTFAYYFSYLAYTMLNIIIMSVSTVMLTFNSLHLKRRNLCSPLKSLRMNLQMIFGNMTFAVIVCTVLIIISLFIYQKQLTTMMGVILSVNAFVFTAVCLSIAYLVTNFINGGSSQSAASNVISLGMSFISGVFVPQEMLGGTVLKIASFTPTYWYVKAINDVKNLVEFNASSLTPVFFSMLIQLGFAALFITISLLIAKQKRMSA